MYGCGLSSSVQLVGACCVHHSLRRACLRRCACVPSLHAEHEMSFSALLMDVLDVLCSTPPCQCCATARTFEMVAARPFRAALHFWCLLL